MKKILFFLLVLISYDSFTQNPYVIKWEKTFGGSNPDVLYSIQPTSDGGYLLGGSTYSNDGDIKSVNHGLEDFWIVKINKSGDIQWEKTYGGSSNDRLDELLSTSDGGFLLGGITESSDGDVQSFTHGGDDIWLVKTDNLGKIQWEKIYIGNKLSSIQSTSNGGYIIGGNTLQSSSHGGSDFKVIKIDNLGNIQWEKIYGGSYNDVLESLQSTKDGGYLLGGYTTSNDGDIKSKNHSFNKSDIWIVKIDNLGNIQWEKTYGGSSNDQLSVLKLSSNGGYILGGVTYSNDGDVQSVNHGMGDSWVIKVDDSGNIQWERTYGDYLDDDLKSIEQTSTDGYLLGGHTYSNHGGDEDFWIVKIDKTGNIIWEQTYGGSERELLFDLVSISSGEYLLGGVTYSNDGDVQSGNQGESDFWVVKVGINTTSTNIKQFNTIVNDEVKIYPNPVSKNRLTIETTFIYPIQLNVYDILGNLLLCRQLSNVNSQINIESLIKGVYIIQLMDQNIVLHQQKIVKK